MAQYSAKLSYLRIAPRKVRLVADLVRGNDVHVARHSLQFSTKRASVPILKLLNSAVSNAKNLNADIQEDNLYIGTILVDEGPKLKRFRPVSRGRAHPIEKKTSHITIVLLERATKKLKNTVSTSRRKSKVATEA